MGFRTDKEKAMKKYNYALKKKKVDKPIIPLLDYINSMKKYYTTSSCSGRTILLHELGKRKIDNKFIVKEHGDVNIDKFLNINLGELQGKIWLKMEPFIIHIVGKTLESAKKVLEIGMKSGLKHSGIFVFKPDRYIIELKGTQNLSTPIIEKRKMLIHKDYFIYLLSLADEKMRKNEETWKNFERNLRLKFKE